MKVDKKIKSQRSNWRFDKNVAENFDVIKESKINFYKNNEEMIKIILKFKRNKNFSLSASNRAFKIIKKFNWNKILPVLNKVLK